MVVIAGPNGSGKSSLFDAFLAIQKANAGLGMLHDPLYFLRGLGEQVGFSPPQNIQIEFHEGIPANVDDWKKSIYVRSAYRNDPDFTLNSISSTGRILDQPRVSRMADNDTAVSQNYASITAKALYDLFSIDDSSDKLAVAFRKEAIGAINDSLSIIFDDLRLTSLGVPGQSGSFFFSKGVMKDFHYKNLSGGEKAAFDLLVDLIIKRTTYDNTVFCIDEPEAHLNSRTQGKLIKALFDLVPDNCQLWVATHSIGMIRTARDLYRQEPGRVCFIDFSARDFDLPQVIRPVAPTSSFWRHALDVAIDDLSSLVAPSEIVVCEGTPAAFGRPASNADHDAKCYNTIFAESRPDTLFISGGNSHDVTSDRHVLMSGLKSVVEGVRVIRLIDRDDNSPSEVADLKLKGVNVLRYRHLECYLWSAEMLTLLCVTENRSDAIGDVLAARATAINALVPQGKAIDDVKSATGAIYVELRRILGLSQSGSNAREFMRNRLAPLVAVGTLTYQELVADIFDVRN